MPTSTKSVSAVFTQQEIDLVQGKAKGLIGKHGFTEADLPDIEQELYTEVFLKRNTLKKWKKAWAGQRTVLSRILDNRIKKMLEAIYSDKRRVRLFTKSLNTPVARSKDGTDITLMDVLDEEGIFGKSIPYIEVNPIDLRIELSLHRGLMSDLHIEISIFLSEGRTITEIAGILGMKRTTLHNELKKLRSVLSQCGMEDYA